MSDIVCIARSADGSAWERFSDAVEVIQARQHQDVEDALQRVEALSEQGLTAVGYVAYEAASAFDASLPCQQTALPLLKFALFEQGQRWTPQASGATALRLAPELGKADYVGAITAIKQHLAAGDSYQVNFTQRLCGICQGDPELLFARLLQQQPTDYGLYLADSEITILSVSPELFFSLDGKRIRMQPMKGTRPRGPCAETDRQFYQELQSSEKERAENLMIVDMIRNDLGRIANPGSVKASRLFEILALPTVWQQVSTVSAETNANLLTLFRALFPSASITGAPKRQTMAIIKQLEHSPRGVYTGALGVIRPGRKMLFNVGIRTLVLDNKTRHAEYGIGSGIVWDSRADAEWHETRFKARVIEQGLEDFKLLETLAFKPGQGIVLLELHLKRLQRSAAFFGFHFDPPLIRQLLDSVQSEEPLRLRLLVNRDGLPDLQQQALPVSDEEMRLRLANSPVNSRDNFLRHKTTCRQVYEDMKAAVADCDDVILWNERGELTETTICNLFLRIDGELLTPALACGLLPGTWRESMLAKGEAREAVLYKSDLARAEEILLANSVRGLRKARLME
ncbi:MAG: aminodeoxychorismate synthase component I [Pseudomonadales bacterium]|nr:aminodeoxychorismate synthase component I [Pseudomonadales bacterium]